VALTVHHSDYLKFSGATSERLPEVPSSNMWRCHSRKCSYRIIHL